MKKIKYGFSLFMLCLTAATACGNVYNVTVTADGGATNQLRGAIAAAVAAGAGPHTINVAEGQYDLTLGAISFGSSAITLTITGVGAGSTIINMTTAAGQDRIFMINPTGTISNVNVTIQGISFTGGHLKSDNNGGGAILCGGPANTVSISNCVFSNNTIDVTKGINGGAVAMEGGGTLTIDQCTFTANSSPTGGGGALYYFLPHNQSGALSITNSVFNNNSVTPLNSDGGAIAITIQAATGPTTSAISIRQNTFTANHANATGGSGGAIIVTNGFGTGNTAFINYNRFTGNTATDATTSAVAVGSANGDVDLTNNWWGCNAGPTSGSGCDKAAGTGSGGTGSLLAGTWLQLTTGTSSTTICSGNTGNTAVITSGFLKNSLNTAIDPSNLAALTGVAVSFTPALGTISGAQTTIQAGGTATAVFTSNGTTGTATVNAMADNVPLGDGTAKASITINAAPAINTQPSPTAVCSGHAAGFTVSAPGTGLSYAWYKGLTALSDGPTASGATIAGAATATLSVQNPGTADNSTAYNVQVSGSGCTTTSSNTQLSVAPLVLAGSSVTGFENISDANNAVSDGSCNRVAVVQPSGASPVSGTVSATVTIDPAQPSVNGQPFVKRHYDIAPSANAASATATITLYFLQSEFDAYNAATPDAANDLPTGSTDATGRSNLRVTQYHGSGTAPGNYSGATVLINPGGGNVAWNSSRNWWEVTFPVSGFSGFYVTGLLANALPVTLKQITAVTQPGGVFLQWQVDREAGLLRYEVETGTDGQHFVPAGTVGATNSVAYSFLHTNPVSGINYYRLKMVDIDGHYSYSPIVSCLFNLKGYTARVLNNPFRQSLVMQIDATENTGIKLQVTDATGKLLLQKAISLAKGRNTITLPAATAWAGGIYLLTINGGGATATLKLLKAE